MRSRAVATACCHSAGGRLDVMRTSAAQPARGEGAVVSIGGVGAPIGPTVVTHRAPSAVRPTTSGGHDDLAGLRAREGQRAERDRPAARKPDLVLGTDRSEHLGRLFEREACRDAAPGEAGAVLFEEEAVRSRDREEVDVGVEPDRAGDHRRVPVRSWAMPPDSNVRCASGKPAAWNIATRSSGSGR